MLDKIMILTLLISLSHKFHEKLEIIAYNLFN